MDLEKATREKMIKFLHQKGEKGLSKLRREELVNLAKKIIKKEHKGGSVLRPPPNPYNFDDSWAQASKINLDLGQDGGKKKVRKHKGGAEQTDGATFLPPQFFNPNTPLPKPNNANEQMSAYGKINAVDGSCRNLAAFPDSSMQQTGGKKKVRKHKGGGEQTDGATFLSPQFFNPNTPLPKPNNANEQMSAYGKINAVDGSCRNLAAFPDSSGQQTGGKKKEKKKVVKKEKTLWESIKGLF